LKENERNQLINLGKKIRKLREKKGYSQEELSFNANIHRTYLCGLEAGKRNPSFTTLLKISKALSVNIYDLVNEEVIQNDINM
jgi:transcriptional regulator with XRE-family HTH domain